ncbi:hypothetical protein EYF80_023392 [Liparis tanakae]|uniref:Uncharacterized protein n=1 Tax=Liparis tanakae TaxID=230148 RepID=A0A4Z2HN10_9TELE|nr:hypothetical protein EYF80_023392 [Liparis tanakae]
MGCRGCAGCLISSHHSPPPPPPPPTHIGTKIKGRDAPPYTPRKKPQQAVIQKSKRQSSLVDGECGAIDVLRVSSRLYDISAAIRSLPFELGRLPRQQEASSCLMMTNDLTLMKRGNRPRAALQAL